LWITVDAVVAYLGELDEAGRLGVQQAAEGNSSSGQHLLRRTMRRQRPGAAWLLARQTDGPSGNVFRDNDFGPERPGFIEWRERTLDRYDQWPIAGGASHDK
jgi:hypothetical protein